MRVESIIYDRHIIDAKLGPIATVMVRATHPHIVLQTSDLSPEADMEDID